MGNLSAISKSDIFILQILEKSLKILFDTKDVSLVKSYAIRQFEKIFQQRVSIQDLTFAKEFRGMRGYKANACVPALELTRRLIKKDPRAIPRTSERVRYIIIAGAPNQALIHCVRAPIEVIANPTLIPNSIYYITKVIIPPLNRCFNLFGIDVNIW
jgi:DNA polymerase zeta